MLYRVHLTITTLVVIDTDCTGSCKSNYHMITTTTEFALTIFPTSIYYFQVYIYIYYFVCDKFLSLSKIYIKLPSYENHKKNYTFLDNFIAFYPVNMNMIALLEIHLRDKVHVSKVLL
jgi:hypothetical protein